MSDRDLSPPTARGGMVKFQTYRVRSLPGGAFEVALSPADFAAIAVAFNAPGEAAGYAGTLATPRQVDVLRRIIATADEKGHGPTLQEIAYDLGIGKITVYEHVCACVRKGLLMHSPGRSRSYAATPLGRLAAGRPAVPRGTGE